MTRQKLDFLHDTSLFMSDALSFLWLQYDILILLSWSSINWSMMWTMTKSKTENSKNTTALATSPAWCAVVILLDASKCGALAFAAVALPLLSKSLQHSSVFINLLGDTWRFSSQVSTSSIHGVRMWYWWICALMYLTWLHSKSSPKITSAWVSRPLSTIGPFNPINWSIN